MALLDVLAFIVPAVAMRAPERAIVADDDRGDVDEEAANPAVDTPQILPTFTRESWMKPGELDARPVMWSLQNRAEDWELSSYFGAHDAPPYLTHKPSKHVFRTDEPYFYGLAYADCGCHDDDDERRLTRFCGRQQEEFHAVLTSTPMWRAAFVKNAARAQADRDEMHQRFAAHFVR